MDAVHAVQDSMNKMMAQFNQRLDSIQTQLPSTTPCSPGSLSEEFATFKSFVVATFRALQSQIALLAQQVDQGEMRARRKMLLLHGVPEDTKEDTAGVVAKVMVEQLKLTDFSPNQISRCHRMGRAATDRPRPILFKLNDVVQRDRIWASKTSLKGSGVTLSEFLTKARHDVFLAARQRFGISKCWTREGNIYVLAFDGTRHRVNSIVELEAIQPQETTVTKTRTVTRSAPAVDATKSKAKKTTTSKK